ncbi:MAG: periplasmic heavy metal sensor [Holophagales bacterium]|nr:periplasmic heavy metal sensor [Holophagales bacterium]
MKRWWLVVALLLSLGVNLGLVGAQIARRRAVAAWAGERPPGGPEPGARLAERLRLDDAQREQFLAIQRRLIEGVRDQRRELGRLRRVLRDELIAPAPDRGRVDLLLGEIAERQQALDRAFVEHVLESRELLDGEQLERYLFFLERFTAQRFGRPDEGPDPRLGRPGDRPGDRPGARFQPERGDDARRPAPRQEPSPPR